MTDGVVLVHGGLHTSACWSHVLPYLKLPAVAVDLPGRCDRPGDLATIGIDDCVAAVIEDADRAGFTTFVLVGHSLGGITITETANRHPDRVAHLVYVGALVPERGSSAAQLMLDGADMEGEVMNPLDPELSRSFFGNDLSDEQWAEHAQGIVPDAPGIMNVRVRAYPVGISITYVGMAQDVAVPPVLVDQMITNFGTAVDRRTIDAGHSVMVSQPEALAAIINEVVT
jgi:pimeloyl-ACP methyl ester carboxylesterase